MKIVVDPTPNALFVDIMLSIDDLDAVKFGEMVTSEKRFDDQLISIGILKERPEYGE